MADLRAAAERRDELALGRDDAADQRDTTSLDRDTEADARDADAVRRDNDVAGDTRDIDTRFAHLRRQILDHLDRIENTTIDIADLPDVDPATLDRLRAHLDEHHLVVTRERAAVLDLLTDLHALIHEGRSARHDAAADRHAAAEDRQASARDRRSAARDRDESARDRDQSAIEREQADPADDTDQQLAAWRDESLVHRAAQAIGESRRRIADSREILTRPHDRSG